LVALSPISVNTEMGPPEAGAVTSTEILSVKHTAVVNPQSAYGCQLLLQGAYRLRAGRGICQGEPLVSNERADYNHKMISKRVAEQNFATRLFFAVMLFPFPVPAAAPK
jgi:hypothetical protein